MTLKPQTHSPQPHHVKERIRERQRESERKSHKDVRVGVVGFLGHTHPHAQLAAKQTGAKIVADFTDFS